MIKKHLIIGNPIKHSLSPQIHNYWFKKNNINGDYDKKLVESNDELEKIFKDIKNDNLFAMNITVPFKQAVIPFIDDLSPIAKKTNSVNTVYKRDKKIYGDNTDVIGFELALKDLNLNYRGKTAFILGAGGVVPSIIEGLKNLGIYEIYVSNRTQSKIEKIKKKFSFYSKNRMGKIN